MKYDVVFKCGCTEVVELFGKTAYREKKIEYLKYCECKACRSKRMSMETSDLPALVGSEKQIQWATIIRATIKKDVDAIPVKSGLEDIANQMKKNLFDITEAGWWIDHRSCGVITIIVEANRK